MTTQTDEHGRTWIVNEYSGQTCECGSNQFKHLANLGGAQEHCTECGRFA